MGLDCKIVGSRQSKNVEIESKMAGSWNEFYPISIFFFLVLSITFLSQFYEISKLISVGRCGLRENDIDVNESMYLSL